MDVEAILKEIRSRVVSDVSANGASPGTDGPPNNSALQLNQSESLTRVSAHLAVTGSSWDGLPPVSSNRQGTLARMELWIKKKSKPLTRWFTWKQVNFNRAVNDALCDVVEILKAEAHELASMRAQLTREMRAMRSEADDRASRLQVRANQTDAALARVEQMVASLSEEGRSGQQSLRAEHSALQAEHSKLASQVIELAGQLREDRENKSQQDQEIGRRLTDLARELKEEQRVCFRQVSLEASESAVLEDRARRALLQRLEKLEAALKTAGRG